MPILRPKGYSDRIPNMTSAPVQRTVTAIGLARSDGPICRKVRKVPFLSPYIQLPQKGHYLCNGTS